MLGGGRLDLIHRVIVPDRGSPKEYCVLVTEDRTIFVPLPKTRSNFVLRREMKYGTALITDIMPKTLADFEKTSPESLSNDVANLTIPHHKVISLTPTKDLRKPGLLDLFVRLTMKRQKEEFQVYNFELDYWGMQNLKEMIKFYMVPLGAYFKPRRQTQDRDTILREYAIGGLEMFRRVFPGKILEESSVLVTDEGARVGSESS